jgi:hypothetical protein
MAPLMVKATVFDLPSGETTSTFRLPEAALAAIATCAVTDVEAAARFVIVIPLAGVNSIAVTRLRFVPFTVNVAIVCPRFPEVGLTEVMLGTGGTAMVNVT